MANRDVTFRRIGGRIVPIRKSKAQGVAPKPAERTKQVAAGTAAVAAGVGAARYAGKFAARSVQAAAAFSHQAVQAARDTQKLIAKARRSVSAVKKSGQLALNLPDGGLRMKPKALSAIKSGGAKATAAATAAEKLWRNRLPIRAAGTVVGGGLIGFGASQIYRGLTGKEPKGGETAVATAAGVAGGLLTNQAYYRRLGAGFKSSLWHAYRALKIVK